MCSREKMTPAEVVSEVEAADKSKMEKVVVAQEEIKKAAREKFSQTGDRETVLYKKDKFDIYQRLNDINGPLIEVGGPTDTGYDLVDLDKVDKKLQVSNLFKGTPSFSTYDGKFLGYDQKVDFQADAKKLPLRPESVGAIFIKGLGDTSIGEEKRTPEEIEADQQKLRRDAVIEAFKALQPRGLLLFENTDLMVLEYAKNSGFELLENRVQYADGNDAVGFNFIFEKPEASNQ